jgi:hypothetical protein
MINVRGGGTSAGYISAGFFGGEYRYGSMIAFLLLIEILGIALGRIILLPLNKKVRSKSNIINPTS